MNVFGCDGNIVIGCIVVVVAIVVIFGCNVVTSI
jgi:hypothetical protein